MCADTKLPNPTPEPKQEASAEKVRSSRYEWERETAADERRQKPRQMLKRSGLVAAIRRFFAALFNPGRNPFDSDDDADPMTA